MLLKSPVGAGSLVLPMGAVAAEALSPERVPSNDDASSLEELMVRYVEGDLEAFDHLYRRLSPRLFGYLLRLTRQREQAEDLVQITFAKIHRARQSYLKGSSPLPWALAIARRSSALAWAISWYQVTGSAKRESALWFFSRSIGPIRAQISRSRSLSPIFSGRPPTCMFERVSPACGTRLIAPTASPCRDATAGPRSPSRGRSVPAEAERVAGGIERLIEDATGVPFYARAPELTAAVTLEGDRA